MNFNNLKILLATLMVPLINLAYAQDDFVPPSEFEYEQSRFQSFYLFLSGDIDGVDLDEGDWIGSFNGDTCVGAWPWVGAYTTLPAMGDDGDSYSSGYLSTGDIPTFKIYDGSSNGIYDATASEQIEWSNNGLYTLDFISGFSEVSYSLGLHYEVP